MFCVHKMQDISLEDANELMGGHNRSKFLTKPEWRKYQALFVKLTFGNTTPSIEKKSLDRTIDPRTKNRDSRQFGPNVKSTNCSLNLEIHYGDGFQHSKSTKTV